MFGNRFLTRSPDEFEIDLAEKALKDDGIRTESDFKALRIPADGPISPYLGLGARFDYEPNTRYENFLRNNDIDETEITSYLFGLGFGCNLDQATRLNVGYRLATDSLMNSENNQLDPQSSDEGHLISIGIQASF